MKRFKVIAKMVTYLKVEVEAKNEDEAMLIAKDIDGGDFDEVEGTWDISHATLITEGEDHEDV